MFTNSAPILNRLLIVEIIEMSWAPFIYRHMTIATMSSGERSNYPPPIDSTNSHRFSIISGKLNEDGQN